MAPMECPGAVAARCSPDAHATNAFAGTPATANKLMSA
jgi:hypothetical protein